MDVVDLGIFSGTQKRTWRVPFPEASHKDSNSIWMFPKIGVPPNHPLLIGFSIINHPFWGTPILGNNHIPGHNDPIIPKPEFVEILSDLGGNRSS